MDGPILEYARARPCRRWSKLALLAPVPAVPGFLVLLILMPGVEWVSGALGAGALALGVAARLRIALTHERLRGEIPAVLGIILGGCEVFLAVVNLAVANGILARGV